MLKVNRAASTLLVLSQLLLVPTACGHQSANSPMEREQQGDALAREGKNEDALTEYLWCWDHGLEHDQAYYGVRLSFLLSHITKLGETYPPAIAALKERLDAVEQVVLTGDASRSQIHDFATLCNVLGQSQRAIAALDKLNPDDPKTRDTRATLAQMLNKELAEARDYKRLVETMGDVPEWIAQHLEELRETKAGFAQDKTPRGEYTAGKMLSIGMRNLVPYYEALIATNDRVNAAKLAEGILEIRPEPNTYEWLSHSARRAGAQDIADEFDKRADAATSKRPTTKP